MPVLDLPRGTRTRVWLRTLDFIQEDEALSNAVQTWIIWRGEQIAQSPDITPMMPLVRLEPVLGGMDWYSPDAHYGNLMVRILFAIQSREAEDYLNFWEAFENSLYPRNEPQRQLAIQQALRDEGAETGCWTFSTPISDPDPRYNEDGIFHCTGNMKISVIRGFNP